MIRDNILLCRRAVPKKVTLPNGRTFYAKYEGFSRRSPPRNVTVRRNGTKGWWNDRESFKNWNEIWVSIFKFCHRKKIAEEGIKNNPNIYAAEVNIVSNKKIKRTLESDLSNYAVNRAQNEIYN